MELKDSGHTLLHQSPIHVPQAVVQGVETALDTSLAEVVVVRAMAMEVVEQWRYDKSQHQDAGPRLQEIFTQMTRIDL
jgi:hypothetical protein